jgi:thymidylate synthase
MTTQQHPDFTYIQLVKQIIEEGYEETGRNGKTKELFGASMRFSLSQNKIPLLTTKKVAWKTCLKELLWFIRGDTNNESLNKANVHIWDSNGSRSFLDNVGLSHYQVNELGPIYGHQWRKFNAPYIRLGECKGERGEREEREEKGVDQLQNIIDLLKNKETRNSRRILMSSWNPCQLKEMALPPCHILCQFHVHQENKLSCSVYQRSGDMGLGVPFNIASYSFLTHLIAHHCELEAFELILFLGNSHIYEEHIEPLKEQVKRETYFEVPTLSILNKREKIEDYNIKDFVIHNYQHYPEIKMPIIA